MTLMYKLFGIPGNSAEMKDKVDRKIDKLKKKAKINGGKISIAQQIDTYSLDEITHYNCYLKISSKGVFGSVSIPVTGGAYDGSLENDSQIKKRKNNDCASTYELSLDFAQRFVKEGLEVLVDGKSLEEVKDMISRIRNGEVRQETFMIPDYSFF